MGKYEFCGSINVFASTISWIYQREAKRICFKKAILGCTYGTKLTRLDATKAADISYLTDGSPVLGCDDCKVGENIHSFLSCRAGAEGCKGMPYRKKMKDGFPKCIPMVEESWKQDNDNTPRICRDNGYTYEYALKKDAILVCKYKGIIGILEVMEDEIEGIDQPAITIDWLKLYNNPTVSGAGRHVAKHPNAKNFDWGMPEELIGSVPDNMLPLNARNVTGKPPIKASNNGYMDEEGRYWVAVGPNVMNPNYSNTREVTDDDSSMEQK